MTRHIYIDYEHEKQLCPYTGRPARREGSMTWNELCTHPFSIVPLPFKLELWRPSLFCVSSPSPMVDIPVKFGQQNVILSTKLPTSLEKLPVSALKACDPYGKKVYSYVVY